jgi:hypothetical protein
MRSPFREAASRPVPTAAVPPLALRRSSARASGLRIGQTIPLLALLGCAAVLTFAGARHFARGVEAAGAFGPAASDPFFAGDDRR